MVRVLVASLVLFSVSFIPTATADTPPSCETNGPMCSLETPNFLQQRVESVKPDIRKPMLKDTPNDKQVLLALEEKLDGEKKNDGGATEQLLTNLQDRYLNTVRMGILGGLNHAAFTDPNRGATTDYIIRNQCLAKDWTTGEALDNCIMKWDANERLLEVDSIYKKVREQGIPGDLMECGVWRGGVTVYMAALLQAYGDNSRKVWVSDSFNGVPNALRQAETSDDVPDDIKGMDERQWGGSILERDVDGKMVNKNLLTVEQTHVQDNFKRFDLLGENVKFVPGYFNESLPLVSKMGLEQLAILRADGDLYTSTMDVLDNLYDKVSPGGFVIFDDYPLPQSRRAIEDFFKRQNLDLSLIQTERVTPQDLTFDPKSQINIYGYFQKPRA